MESDVFRSGVLTKLKLTNFKCHKKTPTIELAPITLLVGPNSSGKTALIQPLLMLKQTLEPKASLVTPIILDGSYVGLGTFGDIIYDHDFQNSLIIKVVIDTPLSDMIIPSIVERYIKRQKLEKLSVVFSIQIDYSEEKKQMILSKLEVSSEVFKFRFYPTKMRFFAKIFGEKIGGMKEPYPTEQNLKSLMNAIPLLVRRPLLRERRAHYRIKWELYRFTREIFESLLSTIQRLGYIGPVREYPLRYYVSSGERASDVGVSGEDAIEVLHQDEISGGNLKEQLNRWLKKLGVAEGVEIKPLDPYLFSLVIQSPLTKTQVNITGTGFGVSQIIPAIVQGYLMPPKSTLILEQPEIHLHPKAQAILADLLVSLAKKGKRFIVETHSEHLILRLQRRVAEKKIQADEIRIYYFDKGKDGAAIRPISIDSKGQLLHFPRGFMEEGLKEAYKIALASSSGE
jgi:predicted ATPase